MCVGAVLAAVAAAGGSGCHSGGMLTGAGGEGQLSGVGGRAGGGHGGGAVGVGTGGVGPVTGTGGDPYFGCGVPMPATRVLAQIMIVLDTSASMNDGPGGSCAGGCGSGSWWWTAVSGINAVVGLNDPPAEWGLEFLGTGGDGACEGGGIAVPVAPNHGSAVMTVLAGRTTGAQLAFAANTPTRDALNIATGHLMGLIPGNTGILLITDGQPDCAMDGADPSATDTAATIAAITYARTAGIATFVLGIGVLDPATDDALSRMAREGGFPRAGAPAYDPVASARDVSTAMNQVVAAVANCRFTIPPPPTNNGVTSRADISVLADGNGVPQDANNGWIYSDDTLTSLTLRGSWCDAVNAGTARQLSVVFHCPLP